MITLESLHKIPIFRSLTAGELHELKGFWVSRKLPMGQILFKKGDAGTSMYIISQGSVEISIPDEEGMKEIQVSILKEGDFFGELSLIDGLPRTATATALDHCEFLEMNKESFMDFLIRRPTVAISMISEIGKRLRATNELVTSLASKNVNVEMDERLTFGDKLADKVSDFFGSWTFIIAFLVFLGLWMVLNLAQILFKPFDEYPYVFLNLVLAMVASLQAPLIMMSQNRAQIKDRLRAELDYQVNVKSELMLQQLHAKLDEVRKVELQVLQQTIEKQLEHIHSHVEKIEPHSSNEVPVFRP
jgi:CRP/FNR family transcriptional regulator, cyclic AMP receptor protein